MLNGRKTAEDDDAACTKDYVPGGKLGAGVVLFWCVLHRRCLGFEILRKGESCQVIYQIMSSRPSLIPETFIYDNACNLHEYCFNRNPAAFINTTFLCDGMHYNGHDNCSECFNCLLVNRMIGLSSVTHEQKNSFLDKLKTTSPFMRYDTFALLLMDFVAILNDRELLSANLDEKDDSI